MDIVDKKYAGYCFVEDLNVDYSPKVKLYALAVLSILGIVTDPTTDGVSDSTQALEYTEPKKDNIE